jgi:hypothetical protein
LNRKQSLTKGRNYDENFKISRKGESKMTKQEQVKYEKGGKAAYESATRYSSLTWDMLDGNGKKWWYEIARAAVEAERPALIDKVLYAVWEELRRGQYGFSESYFRWDRVRACLAELLSPFAPREIEDFRTPQPGESTMPSYVEYQAMTPAEQEACVQKAEEISQPQIHDAILAKMVSDLVWTVSILTLRVDALENGAK